MNFLIEIALAVFWLGYIGLNLWLLVAPDNPPADAVPQLNSDGSLQGEC